MSFAQVFFKNRNFPKIQSDDEENFRQVLFTNKKLLASDRSKSIFSLSASVHLKHSDNAVPPHSLPLWWQGLLQAPQAVICGLVMAAAFMLTGACLRWQAAFRFRIQNSECPRVHTHPPPPHSHPGPLTRGSGTGYFQHKGRDFSGGNEDEFGIAKRFRRPENLGTTTCRATISPFWGEKPSKLSKSLSS